MDATEAWQRDRKPLADGKETDRVITTALDIGYVGYARKETK